ncbi:MAG TPA: carboxypeptidase-like regulatory domain-containing protein, partial [Planctomycetota bacterium]|nr:carboxypeptidase-like regulatory domain-containing protein [Planctomycetota bacterium]
MRLTGRVVDERGAPVAGAELIHVPSPAAVEALGRKSIPFGPALPWADFARTRSGEDGRFVLETNELPRPAEVARPPVPDGVWAVPTEPVPRLAVLHPGFEAALHVCRGYREGDLDAGDITLTTGCTLVGRLVDERGAPVPGAAVHASIHEMSPDESRDVEWGAVCEILATSSGDDGRFALGSLWPGEIKCSLAAAGFVPQDRGFECTAGETTDAGDIVLERGSTISGLVLDAQGRPVAGATVKARSSDVDLTGGAADAVAWEFLVIVRANDVEDVETRTDAQGAFELPTLNLETYTVLAGLEGYEPAKLAEVPVGARDAVLTLLPSATAVVTVVDARSGQPVAGVG